MDRREQLFQKINRWFIVFYILFDSILILNFFNPVKTYELCLALGVFLFLPIPHFIYYYCFKISPIYRMTFLIYLFFFCSYSLGLNLHFYDFVPFYDKIIHTISGTLITFFSYIIFYLLKPSKTFQTGEFPLVSIFSISVSVAIAAFWEISEFTISVIFGIDPQQVISTGITDTMTDIIVCSIGSLYLLIPFYSYYKKGKKSFLMNIFEAFLSQIYKF